MRRQKINQGLRANAETAVADIKAVAVPPGRADVIAFEKLWSPHRGIDDPTVPLNEQDVARPDVAWHLIGREYARLNSVSERFNLDGVSLRPQRAVGEE